MTQKQWPKTVDSVKYHIWTDALHARALAREAENKWSRGTYVRWTVMTAWIALEVACAEALSISGLGRAFKENLNRALRVESLKKIAWGEGLWQKVAKLQSLRKDFVHINPTQDILFAETILADDAIEISRAAISDIYSRAGKPPPEWIQDDHDPGWSASAGAGPTASLTGIHAGADKDGPDTIRVCYVVNGIEHIHTVHPPGTDPTPFLAELEASLNVPAQALRAYRGEELLVERTLTMRGN